MEVFVVGKLRAISFKQTNTHPSNPQKNRINAMNKIITRVFLQTNTQSRFASVVPDDVLGQCATMSLYLFSSGSKALWEVGGAPDRDEEVAGRNGIE